MSKSVPWRFGTAPLSHQTEKKNRETIIIVKDYVENSENTINTELAEGIGIHIGIILDIHHLKILEKLLVL